MSNSTDLVYFIFNQQCFNDFQDLDIPKFLQDDCATFVISKLLGYAIIAGSFGLKIPQILKIMSAKSGFGVSVIALVIESLGFLVTTAYFYRQGHAVSTYGENPIIFFQNMIVLIFIFYYDNKTLNMLSVIAYVSLFIVFCGDAIIPFEMIKYVYSGTLFFTLGSRLPQIYQIFNAKTTGNLAFITCMLNFGGCAARLFTTIQEIEEFMPMVIISTAFIMNGIIVLQFFIYWNNTTDAKKKKQKKKNK